MNLCTMQLKKPGKGLENTKTMMNFNLQQEFITNKSLYFIETKKKGPHKWNPIVLSNCNIIKVIYYQCLFGTREMKKESP